MKFKYACFLFPFVLIACAPLRTSTVAPEVIYSSGGGAPTQIILERTNYVDSVFTPEGLRDSVKASDFRYFVKIGDEASTELPFLTANRSGGMDRIQRLIYSEDKKLWIGLTMYPASHWEKCRTGESCKERKVDDEFVDMRVKIFTRERLIGTHNVTLCNPAIKSNPWIQYDIQKPALRFCTKKGMTILFPETGVSRIDSSPRTPATTDRGRDHSDKNYLLETSINASL
ncbi:hypothetical protein [Pseudoduganella violaceinigra]|uniref:hypothetical protein n=1 Tax=Pseudoduganella violaceinigra TaxID=246602 RepID=UPI000480CD88|nr:hypothetical protein [Pseudoduganella violaceinigra]